MIGYLQKLLYAVNRIRMSPTPTLNIYLFEGPIYRERSNYCSFSNTVFCMLFYHIVHLEKFLFQSFVLRSFQKIFQFPKNVDSLPPSHSIFLRFVTHGMRIPRFQRTFGPVRSPGSLWQEACYEAIKQQTTRRRRIIE
jgi:hypothetical protein